MIFKISPKLSEAKDLPQIYRQTVPQTRPCNRKASILSPNLITVTSLHSMLVTLGAASVTLQTSNIKPLTFFKETVHSAWFVRSPVL